MPSDAFVLDRVSLARIARRATISPACWPGDTDALAGIGRAAFTERTTS